MENKTKVETYIGFCIKSRKCKIGANSVDTLKHANLIIVCDTASINAKNEAKKFSVKFNCKLLVAKNLTLEQLTHKSNAKIMAICDEHLAKAIINSGEDIFKVLD